MSSMTVIIFILFTLLAMHQAAIINRTLIIDKFYPFTTGNKVVLSTNYTFPGPLIEAYLGDTLAIRVINRANTTTTLHWHGMYQIGTPDMDGAIGTTQCTIAAGGDFTYTFRAEPAGTAWYHGHWFEQYTDGLYGPMIVRRQSEPYQEKYQTEQILMVADWYDYPSRGKLTPWYLSTDNPDGVEPLPNAIVVNGKFTKSLYIPASRSSKIRFRVINAASLSMYKFSIDGLPLHIIELDQRDTQPYNVSSFVINVAQRVSFYVDLTELSSTYAQSTNAIYIRFEAMTDMYPVDISNYIAPYATPRYAYPTFFNPLYLAILTLDSSNAAPSYDVRDATPSFSNVSPASDTNMLAARPYNLSGRIPDATHYLSVEVKFALDNNGINRGYLNNVSYAFTGNSTRLQGGVYLGIKPMKNEPLLHQMVNRSTLLNLPLPRVQAGSPLPTIQNDGFGNYFIPYGAVVDIFINNTDAGEHPFHLHGASFWIISTSEYPQAENAYPQSYIQRDVVSVPASGWAKIRFVANNPGAWLFHCHIEWHMAAGLTLAFVIGPDLLVTQGFTISKAQYNLCGIVV